MANSGYSSGEMLRMQQDAIRRVQEMQRRSQERVRQPTTPPIGTPPMQDIANGQTNQAPPPPVPPPTTPTPPSNGLGGLLSSLLGKKGDGDETGLLAQFGIDEEQALILALLLILLREGADHKLILALCYILL